MDGSNFYQLFGHPVACWVHCRVFSPALGQHDLLSIERHCMYLLGKEGFEAHRELVQFRGAILMQQSGCKSGLNGAKMRTWGEEQWLVGMSERNNRWGEMGVDEEEETLTTTAFFYGPRCTAPPTRLLCFFLCRQFCLHFFCHHNSNSHSGSHAVSPLISSLWCLSSLHRIRLFLFCALTCYCSQHECEQYFDEERGINGIRRFQQVSTSPFSVDHFRLKGKGE